MIGSDSTHKQVSSIQYIYKNGFYAITFLVFGIMLVAPIWTVKYLPLGDVAQHAAQIQAILNFDSYKDEYRINWFTPYWVGYSAALFFGQFFSVITAIKLVLSFALIAMPIASALLLKALNGNRYWVWGAFPAAYSFSFYWGFLSYVVAIPLVIGFFTFVIYYGKARLNWKWYVCGALLSLLLFMAHAMAWAFAMTVAPAILFIDNSIKETLKKTSAFLVIVPLVVLWLMMGSTSAKQTIEVGYYLEHYVGRVAKEIKYIMEEFSARSESGANRMRIREFFSYSIGLPGLWDFTALGLLFVCWPLAAGGRITWRWRRWLPLLVLFAVHMIIPYWIMDTAYVNLRFVVFMIPLSFFIFVPREVVVQPVGGASLWKKAKCGGAYGIAMLLVGGFLINTRTNFQKFEEESQHFETILTSMRHGKTVLSLVFDGHSHLRYSPAYMHYGCWYQAEKGGVVIHGFSHDPHAQNVPVRVRGEAWEYPSPWNPAEFKWEQHGGDRYDYFLVRTKEERKQITKHQDKLTLLDQQGSWYLYGRKQP